MRISRLVLALIGLVSGCGGGTEAGTVIEFWAMGREGEVVGQLVPEFERRHPGILVRVQQVPWSAAHEKLLTAYAGDALPDLFQLGNTWIPEFVALGAIDALDARVADSKTVGADDYFEGILETNVIDDQLYGIPWYVDTRLLFYRRDLLAQAGYAEPPAVWADWLECMKRVKERRGDDSYAILLPFNEWQALVILALQQGAGLLKENAQYGDFQNRAFREAFTFYLDLFEHGLAPAVGEAQVANLYQDFAQGHYAMLISGPWNIGEFERRLPPALKDKWSTAPLPGPDGERPGVSLAGGASLAIARTSAHKEAAWRLIEYLSEPAQQQAFYRLTGDLPPRRTTWEQAGLTQDLHARAFWRQLDDVTSTPKIPEWERIASLIARYAEEAVRGRMTADAALAALDDEVDGALEKRRWLSRKRK